MTFVALRPSSSNDVVMRAGATTTWVGNLPRALAMMALASACTATVDGPSVTCVESCASGEICAVARCPTSSQACPDGLTRCGDTCVDLQTSSEACGACGRQCVGGQSCSFGTCGCPSGTVSCGGNCVDLNADALHCGACDTACVSGQLCGAGQCQCASGAETLCAGTCVNTDADAMHCGACDSVCPQGQPCQAGKCLDLIGDSCTSTPAVGINIDSISVYQAGKIPIMVADKAVPKAERPADVVQGKAGVVRVFAKLGAGWANRTVSARLRLRNGELKSNYFSKRNVAQDSMEEALGTTFNFPVKAEDFAASTRYAVEIVECDGPPAGVPGKWRYPLTDDEEVVTRKTGKIKVRFIPLNVNGRVAQSDDARLQAYGAYLALIYPTSGVEVAVGAPLAISRPVAAQGPGWSQALDQLSALHEADDASNDTYYYGLFQPSDKLSDYCNGSCVAGVGFEAGASEQARHLRVALGLSYGSRDSAQTMAHELGHNHGRPHSPCGGASDPDKEFPYAGGKIGWWGFEAPDKLHNPGTATDIMAYCDNQWVSDYVYRLWSDRVALLNASFRKTQPLGAMQHYWFLLADASGVRWGVDRPRPRYPSGEPELADVLDGNGTRIDRVTVYRTPFDHSGGALLMVPDPKPGWDAIQARGLVPLRFAAESSSQR